MASGPPEHQSEVMVFCPGTNWWDFCTEHLAKPISPISVLASGQVSGHIILQVLDPSTDVLFFLSSFNKVLIWGKKKRSHYFREAPIHEAWVIGFLSSNTHSSRARWVFHAPYIDVFLKQSALLRVQRLKLFGFRGSWSVSPTCERHFSTALGQQCPLSWPDSSHPCPLHCSGQSCHMICFPMQYITCPPRGLHNLVAPCFLGLNLSSFSTGGLCKTLNKSPDLSVPHLLNL